MSYFFKNFLTNLRQFFNHLGNIEMLFTQPLERTSPKTNFSQYFFYPFL
ncbi:MAG: DUF4651 domain-containing protein [Fibromonadaceae bacterium]|nr:DUF4651 domain-containing protein [Fibromonadaceae bacterium]